MLLGGFSWRCGLHGIVTSGDCPGCDDDLMKLDGPLCRTCGVRLEQGESAYATDWTVIEPDGPRMATRYQHIACGDAAS